MIEVDFCLHFLFIFWNSKMPMKFIIVFFDGIKNENLERSIIDYLVLKLQELLFLQEFLSEFIENFNRRKQIASKILQDTGIPRFTLLMWGHIKEKCRGKTA